MRNIALRLMYVGTAYHGWQVQKNAVTVAETLEHSLASVVGHPVKCTGAGRTDAGVHAETYIANFRTSSRIPCDRIPLAVNTRLPDDIVVIKATEVPDGFLYNMVRAMVGTCVYAADGKFSPDDVPAILEGRNRTAAGPTVPAGGLYMTKLWYQEDVL